jgi:hypothetical protein
MTRLISWAVKALTDSIEVILEVRCVIFSLGACLERFGVVVQP